jgi:hypothetical protein
LTVHIDTPPKKEKRLFIGYGTQLGNYKGIPLGREAEKKGIDFSIMNVTIAGDKSPPESLKWQFNTTS